MFKSYHKTIVTGALLASVAFIGTACTDSNAGTGNAAVSNTYEFNNKRVVDGGVYYPVVNGKTGEYYVNEKAHSAKILYGKTATANEQAAWDIDIMPDGHGLPEGEGSVEFGDEVYEEKCGSCHGDFGAGDGLYPALAKGNAFEGMATLNNQRSKKDENGNYLPDVGEMDGVSRNFGSYWPRASTLWWYIKTGMPHQAPMSLTNDEVYALSAYILAVNEITIDGEELDEEYVLDREKFKKIRMPNHDGFVPNIDGPNGQDNARAFYVDASNYGNGSRCMANCIDGEVVVQRIDVPIDDFQPPLSDERSLPKSENAEPEHPGKALYAKKCDSCHSSMAAIGDKEEWADRIAKGMDTLYKNAIDGFGGMPPKGMATDLSDDQVKEIVDYMVEASK